MDSPIDGSPFEVNHNVVDQATVIAGTMIKNKQIKSLKKLYLLTVTTFSASNNIIFQCTTSKIPKVEECMKCRWTPLTLDSWEWFSLYIMDTIRWFWCHRRLAWKQLSSFRKDRATWHRAISWPRQLVLWWTSRPSRTQPGNYSAIATSLKTTFFFQERSCYMAHGNQLTSPTCTMVNIKTI